LLRHPGLDTVKAIEYLLAHHELHPRDGHVEFIDYLASLAPSTSPLDAIRCFSKVQGKLVGLCSLITVADIELQGFPINNSCNWEKGTRGAE
jgi:hypothetical protein